MARGSSNRRRCCPMARPGRPPSRSRRRAKTATPEGNRPHRWRPATTISNSSSPAVRPCPASNPTSRSTSHAQRLNAALSGLDRGSRGHFFIHRFRCCRPRTLDGSRGRRRRRPAVAGRRRGQARRRTQTGGGGMHRARRRMQWWMNRTGGRDLATWWRTGRRWNVVAEHAQHKSSFVRERGGRKAKHFLSRRQFPSQPGRNASRPSLGGIGGGGFDALAAEMCGLQLQVAESARNRPGPGRRSSQLGLRKPAAQLPSGPGTVWPEAGRPRPGGRRSAGGGLGPGRPGGDNRPGGGGISRRRNSSPAAVAAAPSHMASWRQSTRRWRPVPLNIRPGRPIIGGGGQISSSVAAVTTSSAAATTSATTRPRKLGHQQSPRRRLVVAKPQLEQQSLE